MTYTSIEQSKALVQLGLDVKTADLTIISDSTTPHIHIKGLKRGTKEYPCWSAEALLDLIPKNLKSEGDYVCGYIELETGATNTDYTITYRTTLKGTIMFKTTGSLIDVLLKVIEWLLTNKFI